MPYTQDHRSSIETNSTGAENPPESPSEKIFLKNFKNISEATVYKGLQAV